MVVASAKRLERLAAQFGDEGGGVGDKGRLAGLAAMRDRGEEGRVGFDQQPVLRNGLSHVLQVAGVLEGHDPAQRDVEAEVERGSGELGASGEAMEHPADAPFPRRFGEDRRGIVLGVAGVDDQRQAGGPRRLDMRGEALALRGAVGLVVIIIEPALADRDDARVRRGLDQRRGAEIGMGVGLVRMDPDAGPDVGIALRGAR